ncbi:MAG: YybH family protein [Brevundimonas sp.]
MPFDALLFAAALISADGPSCPAASPAPVVAAERAFAADAPGLGIGGSFNKWALPDAVVIAQGRAQTVREVFPPDAARSADEPSLEWWPNWAGIARSGDLGFTTGGVAVNGGRTGHYFTIWACQPDGQWRWVYDGGSGATAVNVPGPDSTPDLMTTGAGGSASPEVAMAEVRTAEATLAETARTDQKAAHLAVLAEDGRLYVAPQPPAIGRAAMTAALDGWPARFDFGPTEGGGASLAGDLAWTYGPARWTQDGAERRGHYVRLWRKGADGWALMFAQLIQAPVAAPPPAGE